MWCMQNKQEPTLNPEALKWHKEQMAKSNEWWNQKLAKVEQRAEERERERIIKIVNNLQEPFGAYAVTKTITPPTTNEREE